MSEYALVWWDGETGVSAKRPVHVHALVRGAASQADAAAALLDTDRALKRCSTPTEWNELAAVVLVATRADEASGGTANAAAASGGTELLAFWERRIVTADDERDLPRIALLERSDPQLAAWRVQGWVRDAHAGVLVVERAGAGGWVEHARE
jgi:hypothetical protein